jgi:phage antirepressor YoqD-like protein
MDYKVIYYSNIKKLNPELIHFESTRLTKIRYRKLHTFLLKNKYIIIDSEDKNKIAIRRRLNKAIRCYYKKSTDFLT